MKNKQKGNEMNSLKVNQISNKFNRNSWVHVFLMLVLMFSMLLVSRVEANPTTADSLPHWKLQWSEEFNVPGALDTSIWGYELGYRRNNELQYYTNSTKNAVDTAGYLRIRLMRESIGGKNWSSASVITQGKKTFTYGRLEVRAKLPLGRGSWPAIWCMGINGTWPANGEIDIMEYDLNQWGGDNNLIRPYRVVGTAHWSNYTSQHKAYSRDIKIDDPTKEFHTYSIEWDSVSIRWFYDDQLYSTLDISSNDFDEFRQPQYLLLNLALDEYSDSPGKDTMDYLIDYVRYYQLDPTTVRHLPPVASYDYVNRAYANDTVEFSVSVETDKLPNFPLTYKWESAKISHPYTILTPNKQSSRLLFPKPGEYVLWCTVSDKQYSNLAYLFYVVGSEAAMAKPSSTTFSDSIVVRLTHTNPNTKIYYTLDGSDPTTSSSVYDTSHAFVFHSSITLKTLAVEVGFYQSKVTTNRYTQSLSSVDTTYKTPKRPLIVSNNSGIKIQEDSEFTATIYNLNGTILEHGNSNNGVWKCGSIKSGVFIVRVQGANIAPTNIRIVQ